MPANFDLLDIKQLAMSNRRFGACQLAAHIQNSPTEIQTQPASSQQIDYIQTASLCGRVQRFVHVLALFIIRGHV